MFDIYAKNLTQYIYIYNYINSAGNLGVLVIPSDCKSFLISLLLLEKDRTCFSIILYNHYLIMCMIKH